MILLFATVGSGVLGAALQHFIPALMTRSVPLETIYEEIPHIRRQLCDEADALAGSIAAMETEDALQIEAELVETQPEIGARVTAACRNSIRPALAPDTAKKRCCSLRGRKFRTCLRPRCEKCYLAQRIRCSPNSRASAKKNDSFVSRSGFISGCTAGCWCMFRFLWR